MFIYKTFGFNRKNLSLRGGLSRKHRNFRRSSLQLWSGETEIFHGWVYVETDNLSFFIEPTTGQRHSISSSSYIRINCLFNDVNYWLNLKEGNLSRKGKKLELDNKSKWLRLIQDFTKTKKPKPEKNKAAEVGIGLMKVGFILFHI